jgi:hypothetical protein
MLPLTLIGCSGSETGEQQKELNKIPLKEIKEKVNKNSTAIESLEATGTIAIDSPELSNSGSIEIRIKKPDSVFVKLEGPFGIDIANALITRNDFIYYNVQENLVITGPSSDINIGAILKIKVSFDELLNSFAGSFHFDSDNNDSMNAVSENSAYLIQVSKPYIKQKFYIEPNAFFVSRYSVVNPADELLFDVNYSNFTNEVADGTNVNFPNYIILNRPDKKQTVWLKYETKEINKKNISFTIKVPKSAKTLKWN